MQMQKNLPEFIGSLLRAERTVPTKSNRVAKTNPTLQFNDARYAAETLLFVETEKNGSKSS